MWAYIDDVVLQVPAEHTATAIDLLDAAFDEIGLERCPDKCKWFVPGETAAATYPEHIGAQAIGGLPILGSVADGALRAIVSAAGQLPPEALQPAAERLEQAHHLAQRIQDLLMANATHRCSTPPTS